jgi:hypothetical protein
MKRNLQESHDIIIGKSFENVSKFKYLGTMIKKTRIP